MRILAPAPGRIMAMAEVPDPVFAGEIVGPGVAIVPPDGEVTVVSPIAGKLVKVHPHAFVVLGAGSDGKPLGVLVHLGIDTVKLDGKGFEVVAAQGTTVAAGDPVVRWDTGNVTAPATSNVVPVVVMDHPAGSLDLPSEGEVAAGDPLFEIA